VLLRVSIEPGWPLFSAKTSFRVSPAVGVPSIYPVSLGYSTVASYGDGLSV
jgi:hypothetical protein